MNNIKTAELVYVGTREFKTDNVCNSGITWIGYGDVQTVDRNNLPKYAKHPDIWMEKSKFEALKTTASSAVVTQVAAATAAANTQTAVEPKQEQQAVVIIQEPAQPEHIETVAGTESAQNAADELTQNSAEEIGSIADLNALKNAILSLEQGNPEHFSSTNGVPILKAVKAVLGNDSITAKQVNAAWKEINKKAD